MVLLPHSAPARVGRTELRIPGRKGIVLPIAVNLQPAPAASVVAARREEHPVLRVRVNYVCDQPCSDVVAQVLILAAAVEDEVPLPRVVFALQHKQWRVHERCSMFSKHAQVGRANAGHCSHTVNVEPARSIEGVKRPLHVRSIVATVDATGRWNHLCTLGLVVQKEPRVRERGALAKRPVCSCSGAERVAPPVGVQEGRQAASRAAGLTGFRLILIESLVCLMCCCCLYYYHYFYLL